MVFSLYVTSKLSGTAALQFQLLRMLSYCCWIHIAGHILKFTIQPTRIVMLWMWLMILW